MRIINMLRRKVFVKISESVQFWPTNLSQNFMKNYVKREKGMKLNISSEYNTHY